MAAIAVGLLCCVACIADEKQAGQGRIEGAKPRYVRKKHEAWESRGRIVGIAKQAPEFEVTILNSAKQKVETATVEKTKKGHRVFEVWLAPGRYILVVEAPGYETFDLHDLTVKSGFDLRVDLEFTKAK